MNKDTSIKNSEGEKKSAGNCVIYASTTGAGGGLHGSVPIQARNCGNMAELLGFKVRGFFRDISVGFPIIRVDLERLFGFVFNPKNEINTVFIDSRYCLSLDEEQFSAIHLRLNCIGVDLYVVNEEVDIYTGEYRESVVERDPAEKQEKNKSLTTTINQ